MSEIGHQPTQADQAWPIQMDARMAALYVCEPSARVFRRKVEEGLYPQPKVMPGCHMRWHRDTLAAAVNRNHGVEPTSNAAERPPLSDLI